MTRSHTFSFFTFALGKKGRAKVKLQTSSNKDISKPTHLKKKILFKTNIQLSVIKNLHELNIQFQPVPLLCVRLSVQKHLQSEKVAIKLHLRHLVDT